MESEVLSRLKGFSLSAAESTRLELEKNDVCVGLEEGERSLVGRIFGEKRANFVGVRNTMMKLWHQNGIVKVIALSQNAFQFVFEDPAGRKEVLSRRPWLYDNQLLVLHPWHEKVQWKDNCFSRSPMWIQICNIPVHWISMETGWKIGKTIGNVLDVLIVEAGWQEDRHIKIQVEMELTGPLQRGLMLKYKSSECWVEFRYENLPLYCFYCGCIGHIEKQCGQRKLHLASNCLVGDQYGPWMRVGSRRGDGGLPKNKMGNKGGVENTKEITGGENEKGEDQKSEKTAMDGQMLEQRRDRSLEEIQRGETKNKGEKQGEITIGGSGEDEGVQGVRNSSSVPAKTDEGLKVGEWISKELMLIDGRDEDKFSDEECRNSMSSEVIKEEGGSMLSRTPLQDWSNVVIPVEEPEEMQKCNRGKWKRRARQTEAGGKENGGVVATGTIVKPVKRNRPSELEQEARDLGTYQVKIGRTETTSKNYLNFSVEETSRDWSQPYI